LANLPPSAAQAAEAAARDSYGRLVAVLAARSRDVAGAEDALSEAFAAALSAWPRAGVPENPEAWLLAVARRRAIDAQRRRSTAAAATGHLRLLAEERDERCEHMPDDRLRLMFACAHPAIDKGVRAPLILQTVMGLDAATIASAFLVSPATMGQRLVRAKTRIREAGIPFSIPEPTDLPERLAAVLEAVYAAYTEGWSDAVGTDDRRRALAGEAIWLGRLLAALMPEAPEARGLLALMLFAEARRRARRDADGGYVPLARQDVALWDHAMIDEAERLLTDAAAKRKAGRYQIEAAIQSAHAARRLTGRTDWPAIAGLYDWLSALSPSTVVTINRAVALSQSARTAEARSLIDAAGLDPRSAGYQPYWAARAEVAASDGNLADARESFDRAIGLEQDAAVRRFLLERRDALAAKASDQPPRPSNSTVDR
jgi:RNA polymerase sigma-70 factor (ECF subfamily)